MEYEKISIVKQPNDDYFPKEKYVTLFKDEWEDYHSKFDDYFISIIQYFHLKKENPSIIDKILGTIFMLFAFGMTYLTQIENGPSIAIFFIIIGQDYIGHWMVVIGIFTALIAQFPKRFIFRYRPFMKDRALKLSKDKTSSFPSRAVVCSVVYAFALSRVWNYYYTYDTPDDSKTFGVIGYGFVILIAALCSSFSRIHLGVHYPSDCFYGFLTGCAICLISSLVFMIPNIFGCPSCNLDKEGEDICYRNSTSINIGSENLLLSILVIGVVIGALIFSNWPPLKFWDKSAAVFGSFVACILSELVMVCPRDGDGNGLQYKPLSTLSGTSAVFWAFVLSESNLLLSVASTKIYRKFKNLSLVAMLLWNIVIYLVFTLVTVFLIVELRLYFMFSDS